MFFEVVRGRGTVDSAASSRTRLISLIVVNNHRLIRFPIENCARQTSEVSETSEVLARLAAQLFLGTRIIKPFGTISDCPAAPSQGE